MEITTMGRVTVEARISNFQDAYQANKGLWPRENVRAVQVSDALVDTGAMLLSMPSRLIQELGLLRQRSRTARTAAGPISFGIYEPVTLTIQERDCVVEVAELPDDCPVLIGQVPLELLDFVVDPVGRRLIGNPDHGGGHMMDMF
jgi:predicted aspartyl protease